MESSSGESKLANARTIVSAAASFAATVMLVRSIAQEFLPYDIKDYVFFGIRKICNRFSSTVTMVVDEFNGLVYNQVYEAAEVYLGSKISPSSQRFKVSKPEKEKEFIVTMERNEEVVDIYNGIRFNWVLVCKQVESTRHFHNPRDINSTLRSEVRSFELSFSQKHKEMVLNSYLPHIVKEAKSLKQERKTIKLFTVDSESMYGNLADSWRSVNLDHPATFETLALDTKLKDTILRDLQRFLKRKDHYRKVGKAWKRGYLLYGPPGTGKSSLIAAMANYLNFDVYDLELTDIRCNSELRKLLVATANRSILVVEDIDCTIDLQDRMAEARASRFQDYPPQKQSRTTRNLKNSFPLALIQFSSTYFLSCQTSDNALFHILIRAVTLSGLLNFIDGLWSSCGDERIIVFTTNHKDKLDPALLRPGRMDVHIHMSYCTPSAFRILASNYLGIKDHALFGEIEEAIRTTEVTPAEVAEQLLRSDDLETVLRDLIGFLKVKKIENEEAKAIKSQAESLTNKEAQSTEAERGEQKEDDDEKETIKEKPII
ncbi:Cytochrome BC1 synthesis, putative [Theobroma cacao]|uniref:Cytochrome BC1 synthesis, putative n=1 Tax=Theobroma cacao TaxID=3641 RepID=A0A061DGY3_THECC|nr:Cytochrome BC1 synthesis, putative [Theobroma cacao]